MAGTIFFRTSCRTIRPTSRRIAATASSAGPPTESRTRSRTTTCGGAASYVFFNVNPSIHATHGFRVPVTPGVRMRHLLTVNLGGGTIDRVVNETGDPVTSAAIGVPSHVVRYPDR